MTILNRWAARDGHPSALGRHTLLLISLVFLLVMLPAFRSMPGGGVRFAVLLCLVLSAAIYVNSTDRWTFIAALVTGVGAISASGIAASSGSFIARLTSDVLGLGLLSFTTLFMLNTLMRTKKISGDTIVGGICVYLLIGVCFSIGYILVTDLGAGVLIEAGTPVLRSDVDASTNATTMMYFSFVTLTTLGFGDIVPTGEMLRMLVTVEAVVGQLYIAIFIARLISMRQY